MRASARARADMDARSRYLANIIIIIIVIIVIIVIIIIVIITTTAAATTDIINNAATSYLRRTYAESYWRAYPVSSRWRIIWLKFSKNKRQVPILFYSRVTPPRVTSSLRNNVANR